VRTDRLLRCVAATAFGLAALTGSATAGDVPIRVEVVSEFDAESKWVEAFVGDAAKVLVQLMANPDVAPPASIRVELKKDANSAGIAGWATPAAIGFSSGSWPEEKNRLWIVSHELTNHFTALYAGGGGMPSDWWADGRSPFPEYVSCLVLRATGHEDAANWRQATSAAKPDHALYWKLHEKYGFDVFARFLKLLRDDRVDLTKIGAPERPADRARAVYATAYLSIAAGANLAPSLRELGLGRRPADWEQRCPGAVFVEYEVTDADVARVIERRDALFAHAAAEDARAKFRAGDAAAK
jgi:hypothetical protein